MSYRREIDGLRTIAVLPVIGFHAGFPPFSGGFVGVDVFFVISGDLVTAMMLADLGRGAFSLADFYERRARRMLPALFVVLACSLAIACLVLLPRDRKNFSGTMVAAVLFFSNVALGARELPAGGLVATSRSVHPAAYDALRESEAWRSAYQRYLDKWDK